MCSQELQEYMFDILLYNRLDIMNIFFTSLRLQFAKNNSLILFFNNLMITFKSINKQTNKQTKLNINEEKIVNFLFLFSSASSCMTKSAAMFCQNQVRPLSFSIRAGWSWLFQDYILNSK